MAECMWRRTYPIYKFLLHTRGMLFFFRKFHIFMQKY
jgi:hypothetical protein